ncbi:MAG: STM4504/CBY_0614 family protein, partial [Burkholderiales bacterium]
VWRSAVGNSPQFWEVVHKTLTREFGLFHLGERDCSFARQCEQFILAAEPEQVFTVIELTFRLIDRVIRKFSYFKKIDAAITQDSDSAITELNERLEQHATGYRYFDGKLVSIGSQHLHSETLRPAVSLLNDEQFRDAAHAYARAQECLQRGDNNGAMAAGSAAFRHTMSAICIAQGWPYPENPTTGALIKVLVKHSLVPVRLVSYFSTLCEILDLADPFAIQRPARSSSHGETIIPDHFASYALHLAASNMVFLIEAYQSLHNSEKRLPKPKHVTSISNDLWLTAAKRRQKAQ